MKLETFKVSYNDILSAIALLLLWASVTLSVFGENVLCHQIQGYVHIQPALRHFKNAHVLVCLATMPEKVVPVYREGMSVVLVFSVPWFA